LSHYQRPPISRRTPIIPPPTRDLSRPGSVPENEHAAHQRRRLFHRLRPSGVAQREAETEQHVVDGADDRARHRAEIAEEARSPAFS